MALQTTTNINVDFYDKKYIMINAKQYDDSSRWITLTCYNNGDLFNLSASKHTAYIRYKKADGYGVLNSCRINARGEVLVELTEQMLAADGICYVDLIIVNKGSAIVNIDTGEIITVDGSAILSTMAFCINVYEAAFDNSLIESSYEYDALNSMLQKAEADYTEVIQLSKSYAMGNANNIRENEDSDNSKYYSQLSKSYAIGDAEGIRENEDTDNSKYYRQKALESAEDADISKTNAAESANSAIDSAESASESAKSAIESAASASESAAIALESEDVVKNYVTIAESNVDSILKSAQNAATSEENAHEYYLQIEEIANGLGGAFNPKGTVTFAELKTLLANGQIEIGDLYHISDNFTTDATFKKGAGIEYAAGTNVYYTSEGYFDCLTGTGVVLGVKGNKETEYRKGNINLTVDNIGAIATEDIATVDEITDYLKVYAPSPDAPNFTLEEDVAALQNDVDALEGEVATVKGDVSTAQGDINTLEGNVSTIQNGMTTIQNNVSTAQNNITTLQGDVNGLEGDIDTIQGDIDTLEKDITTIQNNIDTLEKKWSIIENTEQSVVVTVADKTEYYFPNAVSVTINAPSDITKYECWITIGTVNPTIDFPATMECIGLDGRSFYTNTTYTEISLKDGKYIIGCVGSK